MTLVQHASQHSCANAMYLRSEVSVFTFVCQRSCRYNQSLLSCLMLAYVRSMQQGRVSLGQLTSHPLK